jgi:hypothetical protein
MIVIARASSVSDADEAIHKPTTGSLRFARDDEFVFYFPFFKIRSISVRNSGAMSLRARP